MTERIFDAVLCIILIGIAVYCVHGVRKAGDLKRFLWIADDEVEDYDES